MIDDGALRSRKLNSVSLGAGELWFRILLLVDDNGNYFGDPMAVHFTAMRNKKGVTPQMTGKFLAELIKVKLLEKYEVADEDEPYIHIVNFHDHQYFKPDRPVKVSYPIHPNGTYFDGTGKAALRNQSGTGVEPVRRLEAPIPCPKVHPEVEFEFESKVITNEEIGEAQNLHLEPFAVFVKEFKQRAGVKTEGYKKTVQMYEDAVNRYGYELLCQALELWVTEEGGKDAIKGNKWKKDYAMNNFLKDDLDTLIDEIRSPPEPEKSTGGYPVFKGHDQ